MYVLILSRAVLNLKSGVIHEVLFGTLRVPMHDCYQIAHEHKQSRIIMDDTGL